MDSEGWVVDLRGQTQNRGLKMGLVLASVPEPGFENFSVPEPGVEHFSVPEPGVENRVGSRTGG